MRGREGQKVKEKVAKEASLAWRKMESRWRRSSHLLYQAEATLCVLERVEMEIESCRLVASREACIGSDVGLRQRLLEMLFCYNPVWLKLGLEVCNVCMYGEQSRVTGIQPLSDNE